MLKQVVGQNEEILSLLENRNEDKLIIRRYGDGRDKVVEKLVAIKTPLPCTTMKEWDQLQDELGLGLPQKSSLVSTYIYIMLLKHIFIE